jgi:hypothetical protein
MSLFPPLCNWLTQSSLGRQMRLSDWLFPTVETCHIYGTVALVAATSVLNLRLGGFFLREVPVSKVVSRCLPWAWYGFALQVVTGFLLFTSEAALACVNVMFQVKMALILLAGLNALVFHKTVYRRVKTWDEAPDPPSQAKFLGTLSLVIWIAVVVAGRWVNGSIAQSVMPK